MLRQLRPVHLMLTVSVSVSVSALAAPSLVAAAAFAAKPAVEITPGTPQAASTFSIRYTGSSRTATTFRATPPNPGGDPDLNTANDRGTVRWALTYPAGVAIPSCGGAPDPCTAVAGPTVADGKTSATGSINHVHVDGLYRQLDAKDRCSVKSKGVRRSGLSARIDVVYRAEDASFVVTAKHPAELALQLIPPSCLSRPDGIDRIRGNYFTPGFSFSGDWDEERWFTSASIAVPAATWLSASRIRLRLGLTDEGRPPKNCATRAKYERCRTTGDWSGVLTFTRR